MENNTRVVNPWRAAKEVCRYIQSCPITGIQLQYSCLIIMFTHFVSSSKNLLWPMEQLLTIIGPAITNFAGHLFLNRTYHSSLGRAESNWNQTTSTLSQVLLRVGITCISAINRKKALAALLICSYRKRGRKVRIPYLVVLQKNTER